MAGVVPLPRLAAVLVLVLVVPSFIGASAAQAAALPPGLSEWAAAVASNDGARAWPAIQALRAFDADADPRVRKEAQKLAATWAEELKSTKDANGRVLRAHALGALHALGEPGAAALAEGCLHEPSAAARLACVLALGEIGEGASKASAKALKSDELLGRVLVCAALGRPGTRSALAAKSLRDTAGNVETFEEFVLAEAALTALETLGENVQKLRETREAARRTLELPTSADLNWNGIPEHVPDSFIAVMRVTFSSSEPLEAFARPAALRPLPQAESPRLYDHYSDTLAHLTHVGAELLPDIQSGAVATFDDYGKRTKSWVLTVDLLLQVEERFLPLPEKKK